MRLTSSAFEEGGMIPERCTCDGENQSPQLDWEDAPEGVKSFALVCEDPDAPMGTWVHWVVYDIPSTIGKLPAGLPPEGQLVNGGKQGTNDFHRIGYGGPCPPSGTHRYFFRLYALDRVLDLDPGATREQLFRAMRPYVLGEASLMGRYHR